MKIEFLFDFLFINGECISFTKSTFNPGVAEATVYGILLSADNMRDSKYICMQNSLGG